MADVTMNFVETPVGVDLTLDMVEVDALRALLYYVGGDGHPLSPRGALSRIADAIDEAFGDDTPEKEIALGEYISETYQVYHDPEDDQGIYIDWAQDRDVL